MFKAIVFIATAACASAYYGHEMTDRVNARFAIAEANNHQIFEKHNVAGKNVHKLQQTAFDPWDCARGFAKGLQFSTATEGACYISLDQSINAADSITSLLMKAYEPWVWADIMQISQNYLAYIAAVNSNCDLQKLIKTLTTDPSTLIPAMIARVGGGFIAEIPSRYLDMKNALSAGDCTTLSFNAAKIFSLVFDYYI